MLVSRPLRIKEQVAKVMTSAQIAFTREPRVKGIIPDFIIGTPSGKEIIVEAKTLPKSGNIRKAVEQTQKYREVLSSGGRRDVIMVVDGIKKSDPKSGVFNIQGFSSFLHTLKPRVGKKIITGRAKVIRKKRKNEAKQRKLIFVAMPFAPKYQDVYFFAMNEAGKKLGLSVSRIDQNIFTGDVIEEMKKQIKVAAAVIADLSEANPNVLYEVGYSHARKKKTIHICSTSLNKLPFDVKTWRTIPYKIGQTHLLKPILIRELRMIL